MSEPFVFDPRCPVCKTPFGAVVCGETVTLHCRPLADEGFTRCTLVLKRDFAELEEEIDLVCDGPEAERIRFTLELTAPEEPELLWYYFRFRKKDGTSRYLDKTGYRTKAPFTPWQLTVYRESPVPQWFGAGVSYQIFPDRFCRLPSDKADPTGLVGNRWVHENWDDHPVWRPDPDGEVRNRDFFGGSLAGITSKLDYLSDLGVTTVYLCPIFEAASNHRYNTADYGKIDPLLGTEEDFRTLCTEAEKRGMKILLDGVFNHTGSQSLYFNADGFYPTLGAAQSKKSPYFDWFSFKRWPNDYEAWWGIKTLPAVEETNPTYLDYILRDEDAIVRRWLRSGASGWRLDVADELPDSFIEELRTAVDETKPDCLVLGEVWEDASNKVSYSKRRRYLLGSGLHGVMNYPFRTALLDYLKGGDADSFRETMETLRENYPPSAFYSAMNALGTHDTVRVLTYLGGDAMPDTKEARSTYRLSPSELERGLALTRLAALILFTFPGSPTVYYGDEMALEGWEDPFNRRTFPWDKEKGPLYQHFRTLGRLRRDLPVLQKGELEWCWTAGSLLVYARQLGGSRVTTVVNASAETHPLFLAWPAPGARDILTGQIYPARDGTLPLILPPRSGLLLT